MIFQGRAWVFGENVDTDTITPGKYLFSPVEEAAAHTFEAIRPGFATQVEPGDLIVAGRNFGCGSGRESAPQVLKFLKLSCVLAEEFARMFYRNAIAVGLPVLTVPGISGKIAPFDEVRVTVETGTVEIIKTGEILQAVTLHRSMLALLDAGGIDSALERAPKR
jgi:3-isopropylmalate/(R)-2-methylmalate dehydratase small subunit